MGEDLGAFQEDVPFDWDGADVLAGAFDDLAQGVEGQRAARGRHAQDALTDATGRWAQAFVERFAVGVTDAAELAPALRDAAEDVRAMKRAAEEEQARREAARAWKRALDANEANEGFWDKTKDFVLGEDFEVPPMPDPPRPEPHLAPVSPPLAART